jgi:hypothetical protein
MPIPDNTQNIPDTYNNKRLPSKTKYGVGRLSLREDFDVANHRCLLIWSGCQSRCLAVRIRRCIRGLCEPGSDNMQLARFAI